MNNKMVISFFLFIGCLVPLKTHCVTLPIKKIQLVLKSAAYRSRSYLWPITKIVLGCCQLIFHVDRHIVTLQNRNNINTTDSWSNPFIVLSKDIAPYATAFLAIKSGIHDLKVIRKSGSTL